MWLGELWAPTMCKTLGQLGNEVKCHLKGIPMKWPLSYSLKEHRILTGNRGVGMEE
jgi:hypothetical protein